MQCWESFDWHSRICVEKIKTIICVEMIKTIILVEMTQTMNCDEMIKMMNYVEMIQKEPWREGFTYQVIQLISTYNQNTSVSY